MKSSLFFAALALSILCGCSQYNTGYDTVSQGVVFYPPADFWQPDSTNRYISATPDSILRLANQDSSRQHRYLVRIHGIGCVFPATVYPDTLRQIAEVVDVLYRKTDLDTGFWNCRFQPAGAYSEKVFVAQVTISDRAYPIPANFIFGWLQMGVSIFVMALMLYIWFSFHYRQSPQHSVSLLERLKQDFGVVFLALALFFWAVTGLIGMEHNDPDTKEIMIRFFSLTNNTLFLLALPSFRYGIAHFQKHREWYVFGGAALILFSLLIMVSIAVAPTRFKDTFKLFDILFSVGVLVLMGWLLIASFWRRDLKGISVLAFCVVLGALCAQLIPHLPGFRIAAGLFQPIVYLTTFVLFSILLVALTFSWYTEEMVQQTADKYTDLQAFVQDTGKSDQEKREKLQAALGSDDLEVVFSAVACMPGLDAAAREEWIALRSRYVSAKKEYHAGRGSSSDFQTARAQVVAGLQGLIARLPAEERIAGS